MNSESTIFGACAEPDDAEIRLCNELRAYCEANGLPFKSADDLVWEDGVSDEARAWLNDFITRWETEVEGKQ
jgi:hypothetical protein